VVRVKDGNADVFLCESCYPRWWTPKRIREHGLNRGEKDNAWMAQVRRESQTVLGDTGTLRRLGEYLADKLAA